MGATECGTTGLDEYVASLVAYDVAMPAPGIHRGMPGTTLTLVFPAAEPLEVSWPDAPESRATSWAMASGLHTRPARVHHGLRQQGVQLQLTPRGVRALLGVPIGALADQAVDLTDLTPHVSAGLLTLPEELAACPVGNRARLVRERVVAGLCDARAPSTRPEVGHALARLTRGVRVQQVAEETGYSRRHLTTLVRSECGLAPKEFQRVARFEASKAAWAATLAGRPGNLAGIALGAGYADQAHLAREWQALGGIAPTAWAVEEFPFVQDPERFAPPDWDLDRA